MTLQEAYIFIENLVSETNNKTEIKLYEKFLTMLNRLKDRPFTKDEIKLIEIELDRLQLNSKYTKKHIKKIFYEFEKYIKETFSLTSKGYYTNLGMGLGLSFGLLFGVAILSNLERSLGITLGLLGGMFIGLFIGRHKDSAAAAAGKML